MEALQNAVEAVKNGASFRKASDKYKVSDVTLFRYVSQETLILVRKVQ